MQERRQALRNDLKVMRLAADILRSNVAGGCLVLLDGETPRELSGVLRVETGRAGQRDQGRQPNESASPPKPGNLPPQRANTARAGDPGLRIAPRRCAPNLYPLGQEAPTRSYSDDCCAKLITRWFCRSLSRTVSISAVLPWGTFNSMVYTFCALGPPTIVPPIPSSACRISRSEALSLKTTLIVALSPCVPVGPDEVL